MPGDAINLDLELITIEKHVNLLKFDVVCREAGSDFFSVCGKRDRANEPCSFWQYSHLCRQLNAVIVVWLVKSLKDINRETLEWLNKVTDKKLISLALKLNWGELGRQR